MTDSQKTEQFGVHLMVDGYGAPKEVLKDKEALKQMLVDLPQKMGMHTISDPFVVEVGPMNRKDPGGVSGFILIAESHISFHTFPDRGFVTIDVYTCQNTLDVEGFESLFKKSFQLKSAEIHLQKRGLHYPTENIY
ncbi:MAG: adenosylmethionine decarboxylase [Minisyncoccia bacterium]